LIGWLRTRSSAAIQPHPGASLLVAATIAILPISAAAVDVAETAAPAVSSYNEPSEPLRELVAAPALPSYRIGPRQGHVAVLTPAGLPSVADLMRPVVRLAGVEIDPVVESAARSDFIAQITLVDVADGHRQLVVGLPPQARIADAEFSPDERWMALSLREADGMRLWLVDVHAAIARRLVAKRLNAVLSAGFQWLAGSDRLMVSLVPTPTRRDAEAAHDLAAPVVAESASGTSKAARTFSDFLKDDRDDDQLDHHLERQMARVDLAGKVEAIGAPDRFLAVAPSPDGKYFLTSRIVRPYSRTLTVNRFARVVELRDTRGHVVETLHTYPAWEQLAHAVADVEPGPREWGWRSDAASTLYWAQSRTDATDGSATAATPHDDLFMRAFPHAGPTFPWLALEGRFSGVDWGNDDLALVHVRRGRDRLLLRVNPADEHAAPVELLHWNSQDRFAGPGKPLTRTLPDGEDALRIGSGSVYFSRLVPASEGDRPALFRLRLSDGRLEELWRSTPPRYDRLRALLDDSGTRLLLDTESSNQPPGIAVQDIDRPLRFLDKPDAGPHAARDAQVQVLHYRRSDGVALSAHLYLPQGYEVSRDGPLPMLMWVYPKEYGSVMAASQTHGSPYRYSQPDALDPAGLVSEGYAVLEDPDIPVVASDKEKPNDSYLPQLIASAQAAVAEVVRLGVADPARIAVGGHSYGASTVATLLAHTHLFAAGIAMSGAYNRTLTPFGFQSEQRTIWEAPAVYHSMSPFEFAPQIDAPLLLIHGEADNNPGAIPQQSERMYEALRSLGKPARLVLLPGESHLFKARESLLDVLWEEECWLDRFVGPPPHATSIAPRCVAPSAPAGRP